jgi:hypothetical protein
MLSRKPWQQIYKRRHQIPCDLLVETVHVPTNSIQQRHAYGRMHLTAGEFLGSLEHTVVHMTITKSSAFNSSRTRAIPHLLIKTNNGRWI